MKKIFSFSLASLLLFAFAAVAAAQKPTPSPSASPSPSPAAVKLERETKFDGNVTFPEVDGWELSSVTKYPTPDMGYSVNYESPAGRVTVYVYNGGHKSIPNKLTGIVADEMKAAAGAIQIYVDRGNYESASLVKNGTITLGGPNGKVKSLHTHYALKANGRDLDSHIYLFPYNNYFVKFRITSPKSASADAFVPLFEALDLLFSK